MGHFRVGVEHVAKAAVVAGEEHHEAQFDDEPWVHQEGQDLLLGPVHRQVIDVDLEGRDEGREYSHGHSLDITLNACTHLGIFGRRWADVVRYFCDLLAIDLHHTEGDPAYGQLTGHF